jgi:hypothetical protein
MSGPLDPYAVPDELATRFLHVQEMARAMQAPDPPGFFVMLTRYFIEGEAYGASGLSVSATATPNLTQTQTGFVCDAFFAPELLTDTALRGKRAEGGRIRVRVEVRLEDILQIVAVDGG